MAYKALYREYRPETFDEVVGQDYIIKTLKNAINNNKVGHAYLFCGPRGTGKTTIAKLLAKAINCENENRPCGVCEHCKAIKDGTFPDVIEIDAASNNSVDQARDLIEKVRYAPLVGKRKVYIIDEVHMMTSAAFNALLKTLEEPPAHVLFILATTEPHKVLPTIISRCQRFDFNKVSNNDISNKIVEILNKENIGFEQSVPTLIASLADGGVRDALGILDQSIAFSGTYIKEDDVREVYGLLSHQEIISFVKNIVSKQVINCLDELSAFAKRGIDLIRFNNSLIDLFKDVAVFNSTNNTNAMKFLTSNEANELARYINNEMAFNYIDILVEASLNFKRVASVQSYFELTILKLCDVKNSSVNKPVEEIKFEVKDETIEITKVEVKPEPIVEPKIEPVVEEETEELIDQTKEETIVEETVIESIKEEQEAEEIKDEILENFVKVMDPIEKPHEDIIEEEPKQQEEQVTTPIQPAKEAYIDEELILKYLVNCDKTSKSYVDNIWQSVKRYLSNPIHQDAARLLQDAAIQAAGEECIILAVDYDYEAKEINSCKSYFKCRELVKEIFGKEYNILAITVDQFNKIKVLYRMRSGEGSLPNKGLIEPLYTQEDLKNANQKVLDADPKLTISKDIFGDLLKIK